MNIQLTAKRGDKELTANVKAYSAEEAKDQMVIVLLGHGWDRSEIDRNAFMVGTTGKPL